MTLQSLKTLFTTAIDEVFNFWNIYYIFIELKEIRAKVLSGVECKSFPTLDAYKFYLQSINSTYFI